MSNPITPFVSQPVRSFNNAQTVRPQFGMQTLNNGAQNAGFAGGQMQGGELFGMLMQFMNMMFSQMFGGSFAPNYGQPQPQPGQPQPGAPGGYDPYGTQPPQVGYPPVAPQPPVAPPPPAPGYYGGNDGKFYGDPHFVGFDGGQYDVQGKDGKVYNVLSDKGVQYNAKFGAWGTEGATIISDLGLSVKKADGKDAKIQFTRDAGAVPTVDGKALEANKPINLDTGKAIDAKDLEKTEQYAVWDGTKLVVKTNEYKFDVTSNDGGANGRYLNSDVSITKKGAFSDFVMPHGILGLTADGDGKPVSGDLGAGAQGGGVLETIDALGNITTSEAGNKTAIDQYEIPGGDLFGNTQNAFNRFGVDVDMRNGIKFAPDGSVLEVLGVNGQVLYKKPAIDNTKGAEATVEANK